MNTGGESAELLMKMMLNGSEVLIRLTGSGAKNVAVLLYSVLREQNKTKGSERLSNMLRSGKKLRVYTFQEKDLPKFKEVAKQYGILYTVLKEKDHTRFVCLISSIWKKAIATIRSSIWRATTTCKGLSPICSSPPRQRMEAVRIPFGKPLPICCFWR